MTAASAAAAAIFVLSASDAAWQRRAEGRDYFVAVDGRPANDGSAGRPWDLATALAHPPQVQPGDRLWLRGGTYRGAWVSRLAGSAERPIVVRGHPGERATLDGDTRPASTLTIHGAWTIYRDFEITDTDPVRAVATPGSHPAGLERGDGVAVFGPHTRLVNLIVHDAGDGIGFWAPAAGASVYGCLVYNNGWIGPDRAHGHGIYIQNEEGQKRIEEVVSFNNVSTGLKAYGESVPLSNLTFTGLVAFNNGALGAGTGVTRDPNLFVGTTRLPTSGIRVLESTFYHPPETEVGANVDLGYSAPRNADVELRGNYIAGGNRSLRLRRWQQAVITDNFLYAATVGRFIQRLATVEEANPRGDYVWDGNTYHQSGASPPFIFRDRTLTFPAWQALSGFDATSTYTGGQPSGVRVVVRPNAYEAGRAHVIVHNWEQRPAVRVDLAAAGLQPGQEFDVRDVQDYFGAPVLTGRYGGGPISLPMEPRQPAAAVGNLPARVAHTAPQFGVFVVRARSLSRWRTLHETGGQDATSTR